MASKSHQWFNSFGHRTEGVDFAHWWSFIGKGELKKMVWWMINLSCGNKALPSRQGPDQIEKHPAGPKARLTLVKFIS